MAVIYSAWYVFILFFCMYNLYCLYMDSNLIEYAEEGEKKSKPSFSVCLPIGQLNNTTKFGRSDGLLWFTTREMIDDSCHAVFPAWICSDWMDLQQSYLFNFHVCFEFNKDKFHDLYPRIEGFKFKVFIYFDNSSELFFYEHFFFNEGRRTPFQLYIKYEETINLEAPFESDCRWYSNKNVPFKTVETIQTRSACLLECLKLINRTLNFYYSTKDDRPLAVHPELLAGNGSNSWSMSEENAEMNLERPEEKNCRTAVCKKQDCRIRNYSNSIIHYTRSKKYIIKFESRVVKATPLMTTYSFIFDFIGLVVLFLNCSLNETSPILIFKLINRFLPVYRSIFDLTRIKKVVLVLSLLLLTGFSTYSIITCVKGGHQEIAAIYYSTQISPFYLVICLPIRSMMDEPVRSDYNISEEILLKNKSLREIEDLTSFDRFESGIKYFAIKYASREKSCNWTLDRNFTKFKTYYYWVETNTQVNTLMRCYKINFKINEFTYESLLGLSDLNFIINFDYYIVHILSIRQSFSSKHTPINQHYTVYKIGKERTENCVNYGLAVNARCTSRWTCIDHCVNERILAEFGNLTKYSVIDRNTISPARSPDSIYFLDINEENKRVKEIKEACEAKYVWHDCDEDIYKTMQTPYRNNNGEIFHLNLYYAQYILRDRVELSVTSLIFFLITLISIFVGLNFRNFLLLFLSVLRKNLMKLKWFRRRSENQVCRRPTRHRIRLVNRIRRVVNYIRYCNVNWSSWMIFLLCLTMFSIHIYFIIGEILYGGLSVRIEPTAFRELRAPNIIVCFHYDHLPIDENRPLTSKYLDELTSGLDRGVFESITYFNKDYQIHHYNQYSKHSEIVSYFYFEDLKCFEIMFEEISNDRYLYMLNEMLFADVKLNSTMLKAFYQNDTIEYLFVNKQNGTEELNRMSRLKLDMSSEEKPYYFVRQEIYQFTYVDRYSWIKNLPLSLFYEMCTLNDTTKYIKSLAENFNREYKMKTKKLPLDPDDSDHVIADQLFKQFYLQKQIKIDETMPNDVNFKREFYYTQLSLEHGYRGEDDFALFISALVNKMEITNKNTYQKLICVILNSASLWFNFVPLRTYLYIYWLKHPILGLYNLLIRLKTKFRNSIRLY